MIKKNTVVGISYTLKNSDGEELDSAGAGDPLQYLHGVGQIVPGLEKALDGLLIGSTKDVVVPPAEGYGEHVPQLKIKTEMSMFPKDVEVKIGMEFTADLGDGKHQNFKVEKIEGNEVFIDGNHPLAGQTLHFAIEVLSIRDATEEELQHGHAHGPGGHHH
jgi:FKBP-type peptidyl-prolyl cis-trans isomerase SlyD